MNSAEQFSSYLEKGWVWVLAAYLLVLTLSWIVRLTIPQPDLLHKNQQIAELEQVSHGKFEMSYYEYSPDEKEAKGHLIFLPDNYFKSESLTGLGKALADNGYRVIIPDYPGYGFSENPFGDFELGTKSKAVNLLIEHLEISEFHLLTHGIGSGVAFYLHDSVSETIQSITLLSSYGIQELKLLGNYTLNKALYLLQYPVLWGIDLFIPHFGWMNLTPFSYEYAHSFNDLDLRPVESYMQEVDAPVLIIHGEEDRFIAPRVAEENYRLLPQSELMMKSGNHFLYRDQKQDLVRDITGFLSGIADGTSTRRSGASAERIEQSGREFDPETIIKLTGWSLILFLLLLAFVTLISEDIACIGAGLLVARGFLDFMPATLACFLGILLADTLIYWMGRWVGSPMLNWIPFRWFINKEDIKKAEELFDERGLQIIFVSRFIPGTRFPTYFSAGMVKARFSLFLLYFVMAILIWTPLLVGASLLIGQTLLDYFNFYQDYAIQIFLLVVLIIFLVVKAGIPMTTKRGRKLFLLRIERYRRKLFSN